MLRPMTPVPMNAMECEDMRGTEHRPRAEANQIKLDRPYDG